MSTITQTSPEGPSLTLQETALAVGMLHRIGNATVNFSLQDGMRVHQNPTFESDDFSALVDQFHDDPKDSLAWARESLFAINKDDRLSDAEKDDRLSRYLDAYFDLTLKLDHAAFPPTDPGVVREGVPSYISDRFVDMGGDDRLDPNFRGREMILVDKAGIFKKYKPILTEIFKGNVSDSSSDETKKAMVSRLAAAVYFSMPYAHERDDSRSDKQHLSEISDAVCRHHALIFQVLAQSVGLTSRLLKNYVADENDTFPGKHVANIVRINHGWYIVDATQPDYITLPDGRRQWRPGAFQVDRPPQAGEQKEWRVQTKHTGRKKTYTSHDDMFWFIDGA